MWFRRYHFCSGVLHDISPHPVISSTPAHLPSVQLLPTMDTAALLKIPNSLGAPASLPTSLWAEVLQHVPQQQRLSQCAFVCRAWATAAAQATVHLVMLKPVHEATVPALQSWMQLYAGQLQSLELAAGYCSGVKMMLQLPLDKLTKLQRLQLEGFGLQLPGDGDIQGGRSATNSMDSTLDRCNPAVQFTMSNLQQLALTDVELFEISSLRQLTKAPQLTSLQLYDITIRQLGLDSLGDYYVHLQTADQQLAEALPRLLQQLPQLSVLKLPDFPLTDAAMQQLSAMQRLQEVEFTQMRGMPAFDLQLLPSSITQLTLCNEETSASPSVSPELPQLSGLHHLYLHDMHKVAGRLNGADVLPVPLWAEILQHVPQQQRLCQCAFVCRAWATAAAQATVHVKCKLQACTVPALQAWLDVHAGHLQQIELVDDSDPRIHATPHHMLQLPLANLTQLQRLQLTGCKLQLTGEVVSHSSRRGGSRGSTLGRSSSPAQLTLPNLQHLHLARVELAGVSSLLQPQRHLAWKACICQISNLLT